MADDSNRYDSQGNISKDDLQGLLSELKGFVCEVRQN